jgi:hypothetical protein
MSSFSHLSQHRYDFSHIAKCNESFCRVAILISHLSLCAEAHVVSLEDTYCQLSHQLPLFHPHSQVLVYLISEVSGEGCFATHFIIPLRCS